MVPRVTVMFRQGPVHGSQLQVCGELLLQLWLHACRQWNKVCEMNDGCDTMIIVTPDCPGRVTLTGGGRGCSPSVWRSTAAGPARASSPTAGLREAEQTSMPSSRSGESKLRTKNSQLVINDSQFGFDF